MLSGRVLVDAGIGRAGGGVVFSSLRSIFNSISKKAFNSIVSKSNSRFHDLNRYVESFDIVEILYFSLTGQVIFNASFFRLLVYYNQEEVNVIRFWHNHSLPSNFNIHTSLCTSQKNHLPSFIMHTLL